MGLLDGKRILVTGVLTDASLAFAVARLAQREGATVVLSGAGRGLSLTKRTARKLPETAEVLEIDVTRPEQLQAAAASLSGEWDRMDGLLHAIGYASPECLGGDMFQADWEHVQEALHVSAYSLKALVEAFRPLLTAAGAAGGASVVGLDFDATVAWPVVRLDGGVQGRARVAGPVPRPRPRIRRDPGQPGGGGTGQDDGSQVDPRFPLLRGHLG